MKTLLEICEANSILQGSTDKSFEDIIVSLQKTKFQYTGKALTSFVFKSRFLFQSIIQSCVDKNFYAAVIVQRSLLEHYFRHLYIFKKALSEDTDVVGKSYYVFLKGGEDLVAVEKISKYRKNNDSSNVDQWKTNVEENKVFRNSYKEFKIEEIFNYLKIAQLDDKKIQIIQQEYFEENRKQYNELSSFVHGGSYGESVWMKNIKNEEALVVIAHECFILQKSMLENTYLFASLMDVACVPLYENIKKL